MTMAARLRGRGAWTAETFAPGENRPMSMPLKSKLARSWTIRPPRKVTSEPTERDEATAATSLSGNCACQDIQDFAADIARRAHHCHSVCHDTLPA